MQQAFDLSVSSSSSKGPNAIAESQNFCIIELVASFATPPLFPTYFNNKPVQERKKDRNQHLKTRIYAQLAHYQLIQNFEERLLYRFRADLPRVRDCNFNKSKAKCETLLKMTWYQFQYQNLSMVDIFVLGIKRKI